MQELVKKAKERDSDAFRRLVVEHQRLLYAIALSGAGADAADDIVQATWEQALAKLHQLRDNDKFTPWICRICRNLLFEARRKGDREDGRFEEELYAAPELRDGIYEQYDGLVRFSLRMLPEEQRKVVQLRFFSNLTYAQIGLICGIEEKRVKSRLFEAKKSLNSHLKNLYNGLEVSQMTLNRMEEYVMNEFDKASLGAEVFCRLSLDSQKAITACVKNNTDLSPEILGEIGKIKKGARFAEEYHSRILFPEFINILNACDRSTESRLIHALEEADPATAEMVKQNMFVFEDIVLLSPASRKKLYSLVEPAVLKRAMSIVEGKVKDMLLEGFSADEKSEWYRDMGAMSADIEEVRDAQFQVIQIVYEMDKRDEVEIVGMPVRREKQ